MASSPSAHAAYLLIGRATAPARGRIAAAIGLASFPHAHRALKVAVTIALTCGGWILFRARTTGDAWYIATHLFAGVGTVFARSAGDGLMVRLGLATLPLAKHEWVLSALLVAGVFLADQRRQPVAALTAAFSKRPIWIRWPVYYALALSVVFLGVYRTATFIYFQF